MGRSFAYVIAAAALLTAVSAQAGPACEAPDVVARADRAARDVTTAALDKALARRKLTRITLTPRWLDPADPQLAGATLGATIELGETLQLGGGATTHQAVYLVRDDQTQPLPVLVVDARGVIHAIIPRESPAVTEPHVQCSCPPMHGAQPRHQAVIVYIPDGKTYGAPIELTYAARRVAITYDASTVGPCRPPP